MNFIFADDSEQRKPTRVDMKPLIGVGGVHVPAEQIGGIEHEINALCNRYEFPEGEEFKWSPNRNTYMRENIIGEDRVNFYIELFEISSGYDIKAILVASDIECSYAIQSSSNHEEDVITLFLERADQLFNSNKRNGIVIVDNPSGGRRQENELVSQCLETLARGTDYVNFDSIPLPVMTANSKHIRLLQLADVITSCSIARLAGENLYSPAIFELIKPLFRKDYDRIGGVGFKIHPDLRYKNLYHWLLGDEFHKRGYTGEPLPEEGYLYFDDPGEPV